MAEQLQKHISVSVTNDETTWTYQDIIQNETTTLFDAPRTIILTNTNPDTALYIKVLPFEYTEDTGDGPETADMGYYLKPNGQLLLQTGSGYKFHRVGVRGEVVAATTPVTLVVTVADFIEVRKSL